MKNLILIIFLIVGLVSKAQQFEFIENTWYFQKLIIDGEVYEMPINEENPSDSSLTFYYENNSFFGESIINGYTLGNCEINNTQVSFENFYHTLVECNISENNAFNYDLYSIFYNFLTSSDYSPIDYTIVAQGTYDLLIFTNSDGNQAYYTSENLSLYDLTPTHSIELYPNPVTEILTVEGIQQEKITIQLFDVSGKLIYNNKLNVNQNKIEIPVSHLEKGIYFIKIFNQFGKFLHTEKILKY